jgi:hypothetical protein
MEDLTRTGMKQMAPSSRPPQWTSNRHVGAHRIWTEGSRRSYPSGKRKPKPLALERLPPNSEGFS